MQNRTITQSITRITILTVSILLLPLIAMLFTREINWSAGDFIVMGALIFFIGLAYELITRKVVNPTNKLIVSIVLFVVFILVWIDLAVGIFNIPGFSGS